jgi:hypothetical protein
MIESDGSAICRAECRSGIEAVPRPRLPLLAIPINEVSSIRSVCGTDQWVLRFDYAEPQSFESWVDSFLIGCT